MLEMIVGKKATGPDFAAQALALEPEIRAKFPEAMRALRAAHRKDQRTYSLEVRRHGDFLSLLITRGGEKLATAVNVARSAITLQKGREPNYSGVIRFYRSWTDREPTITYAMPEEWRRQLISQDPKPSRDGNHMVMWDQEIDTLPVVREAPSRAEDDTIRFDAAGMTLHVPAGMGEQVYSLILGALGSRRAQTLSRANTVSTPRRTGFRPQP